MKRRSMTMASISAVITLSAMSLGGTVLATPAFAADCTPASTSTWTGDGTGGSTTGVSYSVVVFSSASTCTWTVPSGVTSVAALAVGGGGGGAGASGSHLSSPLVVNSGAAGAGGGGGNVLTGSGVVTPGQTLNIVVGAGGTAGGGANPGLAGGCGVDGGTTSIAELSLSATGGKGGIGGGQNATCTAGDHKDGDGFFLPGAGGDSGSGLSGGSASGTQAGQGASVSTAGGSTTATLSGQSTSFAGITATYGNGGGGGGRGATWGTEGTTAGSGGGGGRESLYSSSGPGYWYGYTGHAGVAGLVILRYSVAASVSVTASNPTAIVLGESVPAVTYSSSPNTTASDWTTEPSCGVYAAGALSTPLTTIVEPGDYVTQCSGGVLASGGSVTYSTGTFTVGALTVSANSPESIKVGDALPVITFTTAPSGYAPVWTTEPTCGIYDEGDITTPLTSITAPGTYITHCTGGVLSNGATSFTIADGTFVVAAADPDNGGGSPFGPLAMTGWSIVTTMGLILLGGALVIFGFGSSGARRRLVSMGQDARLGDVLRELNRKLSNLEKPRRR